MQTDYARKLAHPDQPVRDVVKERPGQPIKLRVQPQIFRAQPGRSRPQYQSWKHLVWTLDCDTPTEALTVRDAMEVFFDTMARCGPQAVLGALTKLATEEPAA